MAKELAARLLICGVHELSLAVRAHEMLWMVAPIAQSGHASACDGLLARKAYGALHGMVMKLAVGLSAVFEVLRLRTRRKRFNCVYVCEYLDGKITLFFVKWRHCM